MASLQLAFVVLLLGLLVPAFLAAAHGSSSAHSISHWDSHHDHDNDHDHDHGDDHDQHHSCSHSHHDQHGDDVSFHEHKHRLLPEEIVEEEDLKGAHFGAQDDETGLSRRELWLHAMGSSLLVSMASLVCLALLAVTGGKRISPVLVDALAAFGGGAMMGDAFLHQLPHAFGNLSQDHSHGHHQDHSHGHNHDHKESHSHTMAELQVGLSVLGGIILFFLIEKIVRYVEENKAHRHHQIEDIKKKTDGTSEDKSSTESIPKEQGTANSSPHVHSHSSIPVLGLLNLFTDGVHNLTDGIALGAAFLAYGTKGGWYRAWFLLCHELPQEVGDFGILVRSGFTAIKALAFNFLSALLAVAGAAVVLLVGGDYGNSSVIEGFTAGGFLYISLAGVLPEMHQKGTTLKHSAIQLVALGCGVGAAVILSLTE